MTKSKKIEIVKWYIIRSSAGLAIMKVDAALESEFLEVYRPYVIAKGMSLADVLSKTQWRENAEGLSEDSISN